LIVPHSYGSSTRRKNPFSVNSGQHGERRAQLHQPSRFGDDADGAEHADYYRTQFAPQEAAAAVPADR
jgi:hypothetical protein